MDIRPIKTEDDLTWALAEVEPYFLNQPDEGSVEAARFDILVGLIQGYEAQHWAIEAKPTASEQRVLRLKVLSKIAQRQVLGRNARTGRFVRFGSTRNVRLNRRVQRVG